MKALKRSMRLIRVAVTLTFASLANAQQPPDPANSDSNNDTATGTSALYYLQTGNGGAHNSAFGAFALQNTTTGVGNSAFGSHALTDNTSGSSNTASGYDALYYNSTGSNNTASGAGALFSNMTGGRNSAVGYYALYNNTTGINNTAIGSYALQDNTMGTEDTASGTGALFLNTTGSDNTASGYYALYSNTDGKGNAAQGVNALYSNTTGIRNLGIGSNALYYNVTGSYNIALGFDAGYYVANGSNNIEIGAPGTANDNGTIQIGSQGTQTSTTIAGIYGALVTGSAVYVTSTGQLGVQGSSERFKTDIAPMPEQSAKLSQLRPVTFRYKTDPRNARQYGLIAEEVANVYPELVIHGTDGRIDGIRYEELAPMLLSEIQRQARAQADTNAEQAATIAAQAIEIRELRRVMIEMQAGLMKLQAKDQRVAQR